MKLKRGCLFLLFLFLFALFVNTIGVNAMNTGFSTEEINSQNEESFISYTAISPLKEEPGKKGIVCFDVNEKSMIAIGQDRVGNKKTVCIYSADGSFLYGYTFNCAGSFTVEWDSEILNIYFVRSNVIISLDSDGNMLDIKKVQNTISNKSHTNALLSSTRIVGDTTYLIRNDMGLFNWIAVSYSQIVVIGADDVEHIIYDMNNIQLVKTVTIFVAACVILVAAVIFIAREPRKLKQ